MRAIKNSEEIIDRRQHARHERKDEPMTIIAWLNADQTGAAIAAGAAPADASDRTKTEARIYRAFREGNRCTVAIYQGGRMQALPARWDLRDHSPDGFNWGFGGSGPSQLALAMCADALDSDAQALAIYQQFKNAFVALQQADEWEISADDVRAMIHRLGHTS